MGRFGSILGSTLKKRRHRPRSSGSLGFRFRLWGALLCFTVIDPSQRKDFVTRTSPERDQLSARLTQWLDGTLSTSTGVSADEAGTADALKLYRVHFQPTALSNSHIGCQACRAVLGPPYMTM